VEVQNSVYGIKPFFCYGLCGKSKKEIESGGRRRKSSDKFLSVFLAFF